MRFDYLLFDLDGTITDSGEGIIASATYAIEKMGLNSISDQELRKFVGPPLEQSF